MINYMPKLVARATYSPNRARRAGPEQVAAWQAFVRALNAATRLMDSALAGSQLDLSEYDVLVTLAGGPAEGMRPVELSQRVLLTKSGMTRLVDRLAQRTLIERRACLSDRRGQLVALTPAGRHLLRRAAPGLLRAIAAALAPLSPGDLATLQRISERIREATTAHSGE